MMTCSFRLLPQAAPLAGFPKSDAAAPAKSYGAGERTSCTTDHDCPVQCVNARDLPASVCAAAGGGPTDRATRAERRQYCDSHESCFDCEFITKEMCDGASL